LILARPAAAETPPCRAERLAELPLVLLHDVPLVTLTINGRATSLLLDTGAEATILATAAARTLGLDLHYEYPKAATGLTGTIKNGVADMKSLSVAGIALPPYPVRVGDIVLPNLEGGAPSGLVGADILADFDLDLDLPARHLTFYRRQTCPDAAPVWSRPYSRVAASRSMNDHLFFPVTLDGHRFAAFIDTGAQRNVIDLSLIHI